ncbi:hypothetical protein ANCDUO_06221, partial [Ancylostoma duodenale]
MEKKSNTVPQPCSSFPRDRCDWSGVNIDATCPKTPVSIVVVKLNVCAKCKGDFSDEFRVTALDMHNYYRRLAATGWAKNGDKYAKTAAKMVKLEYDKDLEDKAIAHVNAAVCPTTEESGLAGENFWKTGLFNTPHLDGIKE